MDEKIQSFLEGQKNLSFCTAVDNTPHCANCFYTYISEGDFIIFKSDKNTTHIVNALNNNKVAGTILPDVDQIGTIRGLQFMGKFIVPEDHLLVLAKKKYYSKYPFALAMGGELWAIQLQHIKMTDNTLGFGKKRIWESQPLMK
ncbi:MAG: pyridoxamine 5'-phosphate oxidase family protein [Bacteroidetes bacterium]|nr:pyridoxamine 5'-phosphate oxidase family protein [Bacteroidota bacterium]